MHSDVENCDRKSIQQPGQLRRRQLGQKREHVFALFQDVVASKVRVGVFVTGDVDGELDDRVDDSSDVGGNARRRRSNHVAQGVQDQQAGRVVRIVLWKLLGEE